MVPLRVWSFLTIDRAREKTLVDIKTRACVDERSVERYPHARSPGGRADNPRVGRKRYP